MPGEKRFRTSLFGFKKSDVNSYIERILREFDNRFKEKDNEISGLKNQLGEIKANYEQLVEKSSRIDSDRAKIADVLIKAQEKAEGMVENAKLEAVDEKKRLDQMIEYEKEKLVDIKHELKVLKAEAVNALRKYEVQLNGILGSEPDADE